LNGCRLAVVTGVKTVVSIRCVLMPPALPRAPGAECRRTARAQLRLVVIVPGGCGHPGGRDSGFLDRILDVRLERLTTEVFVYGDAVYQEQILEGL
jgi:hypothetical protein